MLSPEIILSHLLRYPSVTPDEKGCFAYISSLLLPLGFVEENFDHQGVSNRWYTLKRGGRYHFCFAGHVDVVTPGDLALWTHPPFEGVQKDIMIFGRGAVDMKGSIAAYISALTEIISSTAHDLSLLFTSDEEGDGVHGTRWVVQQLLQRKEKIDLCVVGEPTSENKVGDTLKWGRRGSLSGCITITGVGGHVAYPNKAANPLPPLISCVHELVVHTFDEGCVGFDRSMLQITSIDVSNPTANMIPSQVTCRLNIRFNPLHSEKDLKSYIQCVVQKYGTAPFCVDITWFPPSHPFYGIKEDHAKFLCSLVGEHTTLSTSGGTSDARFIKDLCPVVELGLLNKMAHHVDEYVCVNDLHLLKESYIKLVQGAFFS